MNTPLLLIAWRRPHPDVLLPIGAGTHACEAHVLFTGDHYHPA